MRVFEILRLVFKHSFNVDNVMLTIAVDDAGKSYTNLLFTTTTDPTQASTFIFYPYQAQRPDGAAERSTSGHTPIKPLIPVARASNRTSCTRLASLKPGASLMI